MNRYKSVLKPHASRMHVVHMPHNRDVSQTLSLCDTVLATQFYKTPLKEHRKVRNVIATMMVDSR